MNILNNQIYSIEELRNILIPIFQRYGLKKVGLFGSYAHGKAKSKSDVDLLTYFDESFGLEKYGSFEAELKSKLNKKVDILDYRCINEVLKEDILKEEVLLYESEQKGSENNPT